MIRVLPGIPRPIALRVALLAALPLLAACTAMEEARERSALQAEARQEQIDQLWEQACPPDTGCPSQRVRVYTSDGPVDIRLRTPLFQGAAPDY